MREPGVRDAFGSCDFDSPPRLVRGSQPTVAAATLSYRRVQSASNRHRVHSRQRLTASCHQLQSPGPVMACNHRRVCATVEGSAFTLGSDAAQRPRVRESARACELDVVRLVWALAIRAFPDRQRRGSLGVALGASLRCSARMAVSTSCFCRGVCEYILAWRDGGLARAQPVGGRWTRLAAPAKQASAASRFVDLR